MAHSDHDQPPDRRETPRVYWTDSEVQILMMSHDREYQVSGWILDISPSGFKVKAEVPQKVRQFFPEQEEIHFETLGDFFQLKGQGRVIWASPSADTIGIQFDRLDEESRKSLYGFLGMLSVG